MNSDKDLQEKQPEDVIIGQIENTFEKCLKLTNSVNCDTDLEPKTRNSQIVNLENAEEPGKESTIGQQEQDKKLSLPYNIKILNPCRPHKKLLVLDIDHTLVDSFSVRAKYEIVRPGLQEFLTVAYEDYDIAIWSATRMKYIEMKLEFLGMTENPAYKLAFCLDKKAMKCDPTIRSLAIKPLSVIWDHFKQFSSRNTIMIDDDGMNFALNPSCGLRLSPFQQAVVYRPKDRELYHISAYLKKIAKMDDFSELDHRLYRDVVLD